MSILDYRDDPLVRWDSKVGILRGNQEDKVRAFVSQGLVERISWGHWKVHPLKGNKTIREVFLMDDGSFYCRCQWNQKMFLTCSHIKAVIVYMGIVKKELNQEQMYELLGVKSHQQFNDLVEKLMTSEE